MQLMTLKTFLVDELQEVYISELLTEDALGRFEKAANAYELKQMLGKQREQMKKQNERLETVFSKLEDSPRGGHGASMKAILREGEDRLGTGGDPSVVDASLLAVLRRVAHWEIATYSTLQMYCERTSQKEVAALLGTTHQEQCAFDDELTELTRQIQITGKQETM